MQEWQFDGDMMSMRDALAEISEEKFVQSSYGRERAPHVVESISLALDVLETSDVFEIHASVAGVDPAKLDITVLADGVRIAGERATFDTGRIGEESDYRWLVRERHVGRFDRSVTLPMPVAIDRVVAEFVDGVLVVTLPKAIATPMRTIPVRAGRAQRLGAKVIDVDSQA
jgi:HSP20 family protein